MKEHLLRLRIDASGLPSQELLLSEEPHGSDEESIGAVRHRAVADRPCRFSLSLADLPEAAVTVSVNGSAVRTVNTASEGRLWLTPSDQSLPFSEICGFAEVSVTIAPKTGGIRVLYAEPLMVLFPEGPNTKNILAMAGEVIAGWGREFSRRVEAGRGSAVVPDEKTFDRLSAHMQLLSDILLYYRSQSAFFSSNPAFVLKESQRVASIEHLSAFGEETARYIVSHPEELTLSAGTSGVRVRGNTYIPRHTLVRSTERSTDTPENRAVTGFIFSAAERLRREIARIDALLSEFPESTAAEGYVAPGLAILSEAHRRLTETKTALARYEKAFRELARRYAAVLGTALSVLHSLPPPTRVFRTAPSYRMLYDLMRRWFGSEEFDVDTESALIRTIERTSLYEYFCLFRLIDAVRSAGFADVGPQRHVYSTPGALYRQPEHENTFRFRRGDAALTLYFQPVIYGRRTVGENGIGLKRRSSWAVAESQREAGVVLRQSLNPIYTPDYLIRIESQGTVRYALLDAKFSRRQTVLRYQAPLLAYRYLLSVGTVRPQDRHLGLWLLCGSSEEEAEAHEVLFDLDEDANAPDMHFVRLHSGSDAENLKDLILRISAMR